MLQLKTTNLTTGEELTPSEIAGIIDCGVELKRMRSERKLPLYLKDKHVALIFDKPSLRTRFSFTIAVTELGGSTIESVSATRKQEEPEDLARVLAGYCHGIMIRTHDDNYVERMAAASKAPVINGLSQLHHPCQILADLMTLKEVFGVVKGLTLAYIGDGNNILHSLLLMAPCLGINVQYACPTDYQPHSLILKKAKSRARDYGSTIKKCETPEQAVKGALAVYTDVWTSMGFETEKDQRDEAFAGYQVNEELMAKAAHGAVVMHCLPMVRGKEISNTLPDGDSSVIFKQSENRLHVQKALLIGLMGHQ